MAVTTKLKRYIVTGNACTQIYGYISTHEFKHVVYARSKTDAKRIAIGIEVLELRAGEGNLAWYNLSWIECKEG